MNILVACEESQTVCKAFRAKGHFAFSCDLQPCSGGHPEWHIRGDCLRLLDGDCTFITCDGLTHHLFGQWDLIVAHPPCTYLSKASACRMYPTAGKIDPVRFFQMLSAVDFFNEFLNANCDRICIENPTPLKIAKLPLCTQVVQPWMFGDPFSKRTCLWLKGLSPLVPDDVCSSFTTFLPSNCSVNAGKGVNVNKAAGSRNRSKTFEGIARAMADQWG